MKKKDCEKCIFDEEKCVLCTFRSRIKFFGREKKLKFYSVEFHEIQRERLKDLHIPI